jgi:2-polyprenyl-6-methoxyphenol hydroxylase-like FAD-dependent oxidoreductase
MPPSHDPAVLIAGAGPVGLVLACELARRDVPFRIVDRLASPTTESRAIVVHARSLEMLTRIGVADDLIASGVKTTAVHAYADGRTIAEVALDTVDSPFGFSITTAQTETERILSERLAVLGATVERGVELVGFEQDAAGVRATLRGPDGREEIAAAGWIVGTDGAGSTVRHGLGMRLEGSFVGEHFFMGDVEADHDLDPHAMHMVFAPDGPLAIFPMLGRRMRLIVNVDEADTRGEPTLERLQELTDSRHPGIRISSARWLTFFEIHHAQVPSYRSGRAFLAGDAAHVHSPAGGQGMNTGMQDAFNLGWKLAVAADGRASETLLDSYQAERHPVAARVIAVTTRMTDAATVRRPAIRALRNGLIALATGLARVQERMADEVAETAIAYRTSPIVADHDSNGGPQPGDAAPDVPGTGLHARLASTAHTLATIAPADGAAPAALRAPEHVRQVLVGSGPPAGFDAVVEDPERRIAERYGVGDAGGLVLVRPDGYIGLLADLGDEVAVAAYLDALHHDV